MWPFKKKIKQVKIAPKVVTWAIPVKNREKFCKLFDDAMNKNGVSHRTETLRMWDFVQNILPDEYKTPVKSWNAAIIFENYVPKIKLTEIIKNEN